MTEQFNYDVFISHSAKDKPAVRELAGQLPANHHDSRVLYFVGHADKS